MKIQKEDLRWIGETGIITPAQADQVWEALKTRRKDNPRMDIVHVAYYFGAFIIMSAMGWFMNDAWNRFGGGVLAAIAILYAAVFLVVGRRLWYGPGLRVPGGLLITLAVWMTPLAIFGVEKMLGWWPMEDPGSYRDYYHWIKGGWFGMEIGTILAGLIALRYIRFPFLTFPVAFALWFMSMDIAPLMMGGAAHVTWDSRKLISMGFGFFMLVGAYTVDRRTREDFAFWGYLFGMLAFWGGLSLLESDSEWNRFLYALINLSFMLLAVLFQRNVFMVFGAIGVFSYIGHLAARVFADSLLFPLALCLLGGLIMAAGIYYRKHASTIESAMMRVIPLWIQRLLPPQRH